MVDLEHSNQTFHARTPGQIRLLICVTAATIACLLYWEGRIANHLFWDEGFLWYGVQRVMLGEVPIRDFMAYDPGRYYWAAAVTTLLQDNSLLVIRLAGALVQSIGLLAGLWTITPASLRTRVLPLIVSAFILAFWMFPDYKVYDVTAAIVLITVFAYLADQPTYRRFFLAGLVVGITACIGKNHGVYGAIGGLLLLVYLKSTHRTLSFVKMTSFWGTGILTGYLPMIFMLVVVPGFRIAFWEKSVRILFELKTTNLGLPIPWPWRVSIHGPWFDTSRDILFGLVFIALLTYAAIGIAVLVWSALKSVRLPAAVVASASLAAPYAHYAFSRADIYHLSQGIFPLLIGLLAIFHQRPTLGRNCGLGALSILTLCTIFSFHPGWIARTAGNWPIVQFGSSQFLVDPGTAGAMKSVNELINAYAPDGRAFMVTPFWPGAYAAFGRRSPVWEIYALLPQSTSFQEEEIARLKRSNPSFILIYDYALDSNENNQYHNTHSLIDRFIQDNYVRVNAAPSTNPFKIYLPKSSAR